MPDQSQLDSLYFIDPYRYNCPYCNRRHVTYNIANTYTFDWSEKKICHVIFVRCESCKKDSMHLTFDVIVGGNYGAYQFNVEAIDEHIFYSVPTSFHVIDERIPRILRALLDEAQGCQKSNFLTGASACLRKIVYELALLHHAEGENYEDRIKNLKTIFPQIDPAYFDTLLTVQQLTSEKVHESSYDGWESKHVKLITAALLEVLHEIYVVPQVRLEKRRAILKLSGEVAGPKGPDSQF